MRALYALIVIGFLLVCAVVQSIFIIPILDGIYIDIVLIAVVFYLRNHATWYLLIGGFIAALYLDAVSLTPLGLSTLWYTTVTFFMIRFRESAYHYSLLNMFVLFSVGIMSKLVYIVVSAGFLRLFSYRIPLFSWEELFSVLGSILCIILLCIIAYIIRLVRGVHDE